jgi:hypothetical protein
MCQVGTAVGAKSDALERIAVDCELINRELDSTYTLAQQPCAFDDDDDDVRGLVLPPAKHKKEKKDIRSGAQSEWRLRVSQRQ